MTEVASTDFAVAPDGTRIAYWVEGSGEPLLLVSGQSLDHRMWDDLAPMLAAQYRVIRYDHRGTGQSDKPTSPPYTTELFATDAIAVLDALGIARAHAFGFSMGGRICQRLGIDHASRLGSLVLAATTAGKSGGVHRHPRVTALLQSGNVDALDLLFYSQEHLDRGGRVFRVGDATVASRRLHYMASEQHDVWSLLGAIDRPTLVIHGALDEVTPPENASALAAAIPGAEVTILPGARHGFVAEFPAELHRIVTDFLGRHPLERTTP